MFEHQKGCCHYGYTAAGNEQILALAIIAANLGLSLNISDPRLSCITLCLGWRAITMGWIRSRSFEHEPDSEKYIDRY
jgi:hypothetical protein